MSDEKAVFAAVDATPMVLVLRGATSVVLPVHPDGALAPVTVTIDPAAFWRSLAPAQARALLRAAPKTCGPWRSIGGGRWWRDGFPDAFVYSWLEPTGEPDSFNRRWFSAANRWSYDSADEAKAATDNNLRNNGYLLEDEDL